MGCDIHIIVAKYDGTKAELLIDMGGYPDENNAADCEAHWKRWRPAHGRNYERFAKLSGVRGDGPKANGWPRWARDAFPKQHGNVDYHSHSHYRVRKAAQIFTKTAHDDSDVGVLARAAPEAMFFGVDPNRPDIDQIYVLIAYDN